MENGIGRTGYRLLSVVFVVVGLLGLGLLWAHGAPATASQWIGFATVAVGLGIPAVFVFVLTALPAATREVLEEDLSVEELDFEFPEAAPTPAPVDPVAPADPAVPARPGPETKPDISTLRDRYTQGTPMVRGILTQSKTQHTPVTEVTARRVPKGARPEQAPAGTSVGRCGSCNTVIYAPTTRPLRLRCPACSKVTLLK